MKEKNQRKRETNPFEKCLFRNSQPVGDDDCKIVLLKDFHQGAT